jgi:CheY-like chemotaxis protein
MSNLKKVLVAEDSSVIQNLTKKILQFQNFEIKAVKNGQEVLNELETTKYDIILLDINMPVMDGIECAQKVRALADKEKANVPILAITGNALNHTPEYYKSIGFTEFMQKPLNFDQLVAQVKKYTS